MILNILLFFIFSFLSVYLYALVKSAGGRKGFCPVAAMDLTIRVFLDAKDSAVAKACALWERVVAARKRLW
jgi:hypothetical protein